MSTHPATRRTSRQSPENFGKAECSLRGSGRVSSLTGRAGRTSEKSRDGAKGRRKTRRGGNLKDIFAFAMITFDATATLQTLLVYQDTVLAQLSGCVLAYRCRLRNWRESGRAGRQRFRRGSIRIDTVCRDLCVCSRARFIDLVCRARYTIVQRSYAVSHLRLRPPCHTRPLS
jgi:hypothetical protein